MGPGKAVRAGLALRGAYLNRYVTDEQLSRWPIFIATLRAGAQLAVLPRCSLDPYDSDMGAFTASPARTAP
jgi:hypothetical protein